MIKILKITYSARCRNRDQGLRGKIDLPWPPGAGPAVPTPANPAAPARGGLYLVGRERAAVLPVDQAAAMVGIAKSIEDQGDTIKQANRLAELIRFAGRLRDALPGRSERCRWASWARRRWSRSARTAPTWPVTVGAA